jgi:hypothetical protein
MTLGADVIADAPLRHVPMLARLTSEVPFETESAGLPSADELQGGASRLLMMIEFI